MMRRALAASSRAAVVAWLCGLATWLGAGDALPLDAPHPAEAENELARARLQAVAVEPPADAEVARPEPAPAVQPQPRPAEPAPRSPARITPADRARGADLLAGAGRFPVLSASYQGMQSFRAYAAAMAKLGGRFVVVSRRRIVGEIDLASGAIREASLERAFSPRARDYSDEPALREPARRVRERFGPDAEIMLLVPRALDAGLFGGIARELARNGEGHESYREIEGRYERAPDGGLRFRLESGVRMDGRRVPLGAVFDLDALAAAGVRG
jgi:hypothetical protein